MTPSGSEVTGAMLALPSVRVSVPVLDAPNAIVLSDLPVTWQVSYVCAKGAATGPRGTGFCVNVHDPKVRRPVMGGFPRGVRVKVVPSGPNVSVVG